MQLVPKSISAQGVRELTIQVATCFVSGHSNNAGFGGTDTRGGGARVVNGNVYLRGTTIYGNSATEYGGLVNSQQAGANYTTKIYNSTISSNSATGYAAGVGTNANLVVANSTIAFNTAKGTMVGDSYGAGVRTGVGSVNLQSSIVAMNTSPTGLSDTWFQGTVTGAQNLVTQSKGSIPADTQSDCPLLGHLADNGGSTKTHALRWNSPALTQGNNNTGLNGTGFNWDQRGSGHQRSWNGATDIGAFELAGETPDDIFSSQFENRCN